MSIKKGAFSLVEMLVAVLLISLLIGVAIFSFKHQLIVIQKTQKIGLNRVLTYNQIRSSIQAIKYYVVDDYDNLNKPMKNLHVYFNGNEKEVNYITENPLFSDEIAVVKLKCLDTELIYQEEPLYGNIDFLRPEIIEDSRETILYDNLQKCEFNYFVKEYEMTSVVDEIPTLIAVNVVSKDIENSIYVNIKSDYNISVGIIDDIMYSLQ